MIAQELSVTRRTINNWVGPIRAKQKAGRDSTIVRLSRLGWTQEEIAEEVGLSQNRVSEIIGNGNFSEIDNFLSQGHTMDWICQHYSIDLPLAWALRLENKTDQERFGTKDDVGKSKNELNWGLRTWDDWRSLNLKIFTGSKPGRKRAFAGKIIFFILPVGARSDVLGWLAICKELESGV